MTVNKLTYPAKENAVQEKINEIIDNMGGTITVDQTYDGTSSNPQSGVAIAGAKFIQNTATGSESDSIIVNNTNASSGIYSISIGSNISNGNNGVSIGIAAQNNGFGNVVIGYGSGGYRASGTGYSSSTAIGFYAELQDGVNSAIQLGYGINTTSNTFNVGFYNNSTYHYNWQLLDGITGLIPDARISTNIARASDIPAAQVNSDWNANSGVAEILNKPSLSTVATSGDYSDLINTPTTDQTFDGTSANAQSGVAIAGELSNYADKDFSNVTDTAKILMAHNAMPSATYDDLTLGSSGTEYTAPADGYFTVNGLGTSSNGWGILNNKTSSVCIDAKVNTGASNICMTLPAKKGDKVAFSYGSFTLGTNRYFRFVYAQGSESEHS